MAEASTPRKLSPAGERQRLLAEIEASRHRLAGDLSEFGHAVNVRERLEDAVRRHPFWWIGGGLAAGLLLARLVLPARPHSSRGGTGEGNGAIVAAKRSLFLGLLGFAGKQILRLSEPALKNFLQKEVEKWRGKGSGVIGDK